MAIWGEAEKVINEEVKDEKDMSNYENIPDSVSKPTAASFSSTAWDFW